MKVHTIHLELSAYELPKHRNRPGASFSEEIHRLVGSVRPLLEDAFETIPAARRLEIANAIKTIREEVLREER
ncbi:MAG: hypothetical protein L3K03_05620 [Thermoplasmata archaeon]|nr:hypothetical protein [Thermoplasmata archaeon]